jgi:hypothetical protein
LLESPIRRRKPRKQLIPYPAALPYCQQYGNLNELFPYSAGRARAHVSTNRHIQSITYAALPTIWQCGKTNSADQQVMVVAGKWAKRIAS